MLVASLLAAAATVGYSMIVEHRVPPELCFYVPCSLRAEWRCGECEEGNWLSRPMADPYEQHK